MQQQSVRTSQRVSRFLASWGVDRPFANLAETAQLAQHIGENVRRFHALLLFYELFYLRVSGYLVVLIKIFLFFCLFDVVFKKCLQKLNSHTLHFPKEI